MALIESTKDGRPLYRVRWNYRRDAKGRKTYDEKRFRDRKAAVKLEREKTAGHSTATETITVVTLAALWKRDHLDAGNVQKRTARYYDTHVRLRITPHIGTKQVSKLTPIAIRNWRQSMQDSGVSAGNVNKTLDTLKTMIRWGRSEGLCTNTMVDDARRVRSEPPKAANPYTPAQVEQIAKGCEYLRDATMVNLAAYAGLRWSELRALRWTDIDLKTGMITLARSLDHDHTMKTTKSNRVRQVPILAPGLTALKRWKSEGPDTKLVFASPTGKPLGNNVWYSHRLPKIREASGIHFDLHQLRDTYASILIATGVDSSELTLWLGHRSIQTTIDRYGALFSSRRNAMVAQANERLLKL